VDKLTKKEIEEMCQLTDEELYVIFSQAIIEQGQLGITSPTETKRRLNNIRKWLLELLGN
jgi:hypothetical protein